MMVREKGDSEVWFVQNEDNDSEVRFCSVDGDDDGFAKSYSCDKSAMWNDDDDDVCSEKKNDGDDRCVIMTTRNEKKESAM